MITAVVDTTVLSNFAHTRQPRLLAAARKWLVLTDDRDARQAAQESGVPVSGTLGALMNLVRSKVLREEEADVLLALMKQHGYRSPVNSLAELTGD